MNSKIIICVKSCLRDLQRGDHHAIRNTWGKSAAHEGILVRFFIGKQDVMPKLLPDEVMLDCGDEYIDLPFKTREICKWASSKTANYIFLCDTDTYISIPLFLNSKFEKEDYLGEMPYPVMKVHSRYKTDPGPDGKVEHRDRCYTWASGGVGYFLSRRAAMAVANEYPDSWAEDLWVGQVILPKVHAGEMTAMNTRENNYTGTKFSWHFPSTEWGGQKYCEVHHGWMDVEHRKSR
jgi:Galactosyltransferase